MRSARDWKRYYEQERERLGEAGLLGLLDRAPRLDLPPLGALVFPHTRLAESGELVAAAALAVVRGGHDTVLALGVLHGGREVDAALTRAARSGDQQAISQLRRVHGPGLSEDAGHWREEFSLDGFRALVEAAARRADRRAPRIIERYPFLVGDRPDDLPGLDDLRHLVAHGCAVVATADPIHHGAGYGTPLALRRLRQDPQTLEMAKALVEDGLRLLTGRDFAGFLGHCAAVGSDFRDNGIVTAVLLDAPTLAAQIAELRLIDYVEALDADEPTWVAAALAQILPAENVSGFTLH